MGCPDEGSVTVYLLELSKQPTCKQFINAICHFFFANLVLELSFLWNLCFFQ